MMTYLPIEKFSETATVLRDAELYPSRTDAWKVMQALLGIETRWIHNPLCVMWSGYEFTLGQYALTMCNEWKVRHGGDTLHERFVRLIEDAMGAGIMRPQDSADKPWWLGNEGFHLSHRSNLVRLDREHYGKIWPGVPPDLPFVTPKAKAERVKVESK